MNWYKIIGIATTAFLLGFLFSVVAKDPYNSEVESENSTSTLKDTIYITASFTYPPIIKEVIRYKTYKKRSTTINNITVTYRGELIDIKNHDEVQHYYWKSGGDSLYSHKVNTEGVLDTLPNVPKY